MFHVKTKGTCKQHNNARGCKNKTMKSIFHEFCGLRREIEKNDEKNLREKQEDLMAPFQS